LFNIKQPRKRNKGNQETESSTILNRYILLSCHEDIKANHFANLDGVYDAF